MERRSVCRSRAFGGRPPSEGSWCGQAMYVARESRAQLSWRHELLRRAFRERACSLQTAALERGPPGHAHLSGLPPRRVPLSPSGTTLSGSAVPGWGASWNFALGESVLAFVWPLRRSWGEGWVGWSTCLYSCFFGCVFAQLAVSEIEAGSAEHCAVQLWALRLFILFLWGQVTTAKVFRLPAPSRIHGCFTIDSCSHTEAELTLPEAALTVKP